MSWPVYSERLISAQGTGAGSSWRVPAGYRAVIRNVAAVQGGAVAGFAYVVAGPMTLWIRSFPASRESFSQEYRAVVYAGELIEAYTSAVELSISAHGYLFLDSSGRKGPPLSATELPSRPFEPIYGPDPEPR